MKQSAAVKKQQPVLRGTEQSTGHVEMIYKKNSRGKRGQKRKVTLSLQDVADAEMQRNTCGKTVLPVMPNAGNVKKKDILQKNADQAAASMISHRCR